jgi:PAS domain S-box-containing protein
MRLGIKEKILLVLIAALVLTAALQALLASSVTNRQNEASAFAVLNRDLLAWENDLQEATLQLREAALAAVGDDVVLNQLAELETLELDLGDPLKSGESVELARTQAYNKSVSLNRLHLVLRTSGFSSIAVYSRGTLSHLVSAADAGMLVRRRGNRTWVAARADADGNLPFQSWPAWEAASPPAYVTTAVEGLTQPTVSFEFPVPDLTVIQVAVPVQGVIDLLRPDTERPVTARVASQLAIAGGPASRTGGSPGRRPVIFATVVFRMVIDRAVLGKVAQKTGKWPSLFSPDGSHQQEILQLGLSRQQLLQRIQRPAGDVTPGEYHGTIMLGQGSYYLALRRWEFEGRPGLMLGMAVSRESTLENIRQTVTASVAAAGVILVLSIVVGAIGVARLVNPIVALTGAVKAIGLHSRPGAAADTTHRTALTQLRPIDIRARDEIGDLAEAFNVMLAELRNSFETLEQRVQARTAEVRQRTRYLRTLIDMLPWWAWLKDTNSNYLAANQATAEACGRTADEMVGKSDLEFWPRELAEAYRADDREVMTSRQRKTVEEPFADLKGTVWIETYKAPVLDEDGTVLGTVGVARNISDRKAVEAAREAALAEAERLARLRSEFLAQMSHELRTPLNSILGYAQILRQDRTLGERQAAGMRVIQQSGEHLLALIDDVLDFAKIEAGRLQLSRSEVALHEFLRGIADTIRVKAEQKQLEFRLEMAAGLPGGIWVDEKRLRQVLLNLLDNAVKFTDRGRVTLRVSAVAPGRLGFEVEDTGTGIREDQLEIVFRPFEQVGDRRRRTGGTGLGLPISRQFVRLMGSDIQVESRVGEGSVFRFEVDAPVVDAAGAGAGHPESVVTGYSGPRKRVLVVDDIAENRAVLVEMLGHLGFEVVEAMDGRDGVARAESLRPDLVLMDIVMPDLDGLQAIRRIRQLAETRAVAIIAVSASASSGDEERCLREGANAFLPKPVDRGRLLALISRLLKLEWVLESSGATADSAGEPSGPRLVPPVEELEQLHRLARAGNMRDILLWAAELAGRDERYRPFCDHLRRLAHGYQSKAILSFVEQYRNRGPTT